jgi:alpha-L-fucosidase 2
MIKKLLFFASLCFTTAATAQNAGLKLWYKQPPVRYGKQQCHLVMAGWQPMVYGNPDKECIQLNEATVWSGGPNRNDSETSLAALPEVRKLIFEGKNKEAAALATQKIKSNRINGMQYQPVGNLLLNFPGHDSYTGYRRELDLTKAVTTTNYIANGVQFKREAFVSIPDQVVVIRLTASKPGSISFIAGMNSTQRAEVTTRAKDELVLSGISGDKDGVKSKIKFQSLVKFNSDGGKLSASDSTVTVNGANSVTVLISIATNFVNYNDVSGNEQKRAAEYLNNAEGKSYDQLLMAHIKAYQKYFNRVKLDLGTTDSVKNPTDIRIRDFAKGNDPQLVALYFQFGRYLLISSSQPGGQPANLQGIWNDKQSPPWGSKYTININTEMNYWPAEETNLAEMHEPLIQMVKELSITGQETAKKCTVPTVG